MFSWLFGQKKVDPEPVVDSEVTTAERVREKYLSFRDLLSLNTECLELIVDLQEDVRYVPPKRDVVSTRVGDIFERARAIVECLERLTGYRHELLRGALEKQKHEVERYIADLQERMNVRLAGWMYEIGIGDIAEAGGKAAALGEVARHLKLPVPNGYVLTTEAYQQFFGIPQWHVIRDAIHDLEPTDFEAIRDVARGLQEMVMKTELPRALEVAITERARALEADRLAVRSSAVGEGPEGGSRTCAGQFLSLINVPVADVVDAYKQVVASRFSERALAYRISSGLLEVDTPMAVLVLPVIQARASGIMYTRNPGDPKNQELWITSTSGFGMDIASGSTPADLFIVSRKRKHEVLESHIAAKPEKLIMSPTGGFDRQALSAEAGRTASLDAEAIRILAGHGIRLEKYFDTAQDVEWAQDDSGQIWILQTRPLALADAGRSRNKSKIKQDPVLEGGRAVYPGRVSGRAFLAESIQKLNDAPAGSIVFLRRATPEIVQRFPHIWGLVAEWGNVAGHAAALLREFKIPSVFLMEGAFEKIQTGAAVSLDTIQCKVYEGALWGGRQVDVSDETMERSIPSDPISRSILTLNLLDPSDQDFSPGGCKSTHDVLRYCHEKGVEAMFTVNDLELDQGQRGSRDLDTQLPLNISVLDLGGGVEIRDSRDSKVKPNEITSLPFQALWKGVSNPDVTWKREMPASLSDLASVMATSLGPKSYVARPLGKKSYLLVADEYMNFNARVAYHFTLVDASLTESPSKNYIAFRFAGGGATPYRRSLRACFVEEVLMHYGFLVDRRSDLVNAWLKKAPAPETFEALDILGRLMACTSQLDMYMTSCDVMKWYVRQFLDGNYLFRRTKVAEPAGETVQSDE